MSTRERRDYITQLKDDLYIYEGSHNWEERPFVLYDNIGDAHYPPTVVLRQDKGIPVDFPEYDMLVKEEGKTPVLFTGAHSRLLYELEQGLVVPNTDRVLVNVDRHSDFENVDGSNYNDQYVHIGNWGYKGIERDYWRTFLHVSRTYEDSERFSIRRLSRVFDWSMYNRKTQKGYKGLYYEISFHNPFVLGAIQEIKKIIGGRPYILTIDADEFASWKRDLNPEDEQILTTLLNLSLQDPNMELLHFTVSPYYCPAEWARKQWDIVRKAYAQLDKLSNALK